MLFKDILNNVDDITTGFQPVLSFSFATFSVGMFFELFFEKQRISVSCAVRQLQKKMKTYVKKVKVNMTDAPSLGVEKSELSRF